MIVILVNTILKIYFLNDGQLTQLKTQYRSIAKHKISQIVSNKQPLFSKMGPYGVTSESHILPISTYVLMVQKLHKVSLDYIVHLNILDDMFRILFILSSKLRFR